MSAWTGGCPWQIVYALLHGEPHQAMPGGMEFDFVPPSATTVVSAQHRRVVVCECAPLDGFRSSQRAAEGLQLRAGPSGVLPRYGFTQRPVGRERVVSGQRRGLIPDFIIHGSYY